MGLSPAQVKRAADVRERLLAAAAGLLVSVGVHGVTLDAVARSAGVSKGGLLHHFSNKQKLIEAVLADLLNKLGKDIDDHMTRDPEPYGRFTRAYVATTFVDFDGERGNLWAALSVALLSDPSLRRIWGEWLTVQLEKHRETDTAPSLATVRLAADGVWLAHLLKHASVPMPDFAEVRRDLMALSRRREI